MLGNNCYCCKEGPILKAGPQQHFYCLQKQSSIPKTGKEIQDLPAISNTVIGFMFAGTNVSSLTIFGKLRVEVGGVQMFAFLSGFSIDPLQ